MNEIDRLRKNVFDNLQEIERLNNIIEEFEKWLERHSIINYECNETIVHEQMALSMALSKLKELKENKNEIEKLGC